MTHIIGSEKRKRIKFIDGVLERSYNDIQGRIEDAKAMEKERVSIIERIKNDSKLSSNRKQNIIDSSREPRPLNTSDFSGHKITSKIDLDSVNNIIKNISRDTQIVSSNVVIEDSEIKKIFQR